MTLMTSGLALGVAGAFFTFAKASAILADQKGKGGEIFLFYGAISRNGE
ncbi:MAG: hypothetical protein K0B01_01805 [Syntrophobacterales bacterium]|nr:hypothetical protein [Syntrophobacterales bacterium]